MPPRETERENAIKSSLGINYFSNRDTAFIFGDKWLEGKRRDDNIGGLWRIHDGLYDLEDFISRHPGGPEWLRLTKGTDATEAFETHHLRNVDEYLSKFFVRKASTPRVSTFTFHDDGFYRTLKKRVLNELPKLPKHIIQESKMYADVVVGSYLLLSIIATYSESYILGFLAGLLLTLNMNISHNFLHQRDNFRMYYFDLSMTSSREFRISHALSHHLFPNTIHDMEISMFEPLFYILPLRKTKLEKCFSWLQALVLFWFMAIILHVTRLFREKKTIIAIIPWLPLLLTYLVTDQNFVKCFMMFIWIKCSCSLLFGLIGKTAAHHHPDIFHEGDAARPLEEMDFGVHQLDAVGDRPNINSSRVLVLTNFGDHALHHLFPTLDHGVLEYLYPIFVQTCMEFGVDWKLYSSIDLLKGALKQLARDKPNANPPQPLKKRIK